MPERVLALAQEISKLVATGLGGVERCTGRTKVLSINARIEAARSGMVGKGFEVVASEMNDISKQIDSLAEELRTGLDRRVTDLGVLAQGLIASVRGQRLADLALNMIDVIDRNLYERSCDVRWWATDSAVVRCLEEGTPAAQQHASSRLGVILDSYTVYSDLWIVGRDGRVVANGRPRYTAKGVDCSREAWFVEAMRTRSGADFAVADIRTCAPLEGRAVATYAAAIREGGQAEGAALGVLGISFDWQTQSETVVRNVRMSNDEKNRSRALLIDSHHRVIAASNGVGILQETYNLDTKGHSLGSYDAGDKVVGFALTPGYETYKGLGWYGVVELYK